MLAFGPLGVKRKGDAGKKGRGLCAEEAVSAKVVVIRCGRASKRSSECLKALLSAASSAFSLLFLSFIA